MHQSGWKRGDRIVHADRPEWGIGSIIDAQAVTHNGTRSQRLRIRFERAGIKVLATAHASLRRPEPTSSERGADRAVCGGLAPGASESDDPTILLGTLPEETTDPFALPESRLAATGRQYRFTGTGGSLLDWAAARTEMADPLSRYTRGQLEEFFERYRRLLDENLFQLARDLIRTDPVRAARTLGELPPAARRVLEAHHARR